MASSAAILSSNPTIFSPKLSSPSVPNSFVGLRKPSLSARPRSFSLNPASHSRRSFVVKASSPQNRSMSLHQWGFDILNARWRKDSSVSIAQHNRCHHYNVLESSRQKRAMENVQIRLSSLQWVGLNMMGPQRRPKPKPLFASLPVPPPLDLTEDNVRQVLTDARAELGQIFDASVGITGKVDLAELDGPFVKISLKGRFWHKRSDVLARVGNYLKQRIPEILEVDIEDEKQLDDSPENF